MKFKSIYKKLIYIILSLVIIPSLIYFAVYIFNTSESSYENYCTSNESILMGINMRLEDYISRLETHADFIMFENEDSIEKEGLIKGEKKGALPIDLETSIAHVYNQNEEIESILIYNTTTKEFTRFNQHGFATFEKAQDLEMQIWPRDVQISLTGHTIIAQHKHINYDEKYQMNNSIEVFSYGKQYDLNGQKLMLLINSKNYFLRAICHEAIEFRDETIQMLNRYGEIIYSSNKDFSIYDRNDIFDHIEKSDKNTDSFKFISDKDGKEKMVVYVRSPYNKNIYVKCIETEVLNEMLYGGIKQMLLIFCGTLLGTIFLVILISKSFIKPLLNLKNGIDNFAGGDRNTKIEIENNDEIGAIAKSFNIMASNINTLIEDKYELEIFNRNAKYYSLIAQINPHFINNVLQSIGAIGLEKDVPEIYEGTMLLGKMLRYTIKEEDTVTIRKEISNLRDYLQVQNLRFENKISAEIFADEHVLDFQLPKFTFQPLVENAMIHGLEKKKGKGEIKVTVKKEGTKIFIKIEDDGVGMTRERREEILQNIKNNQIEIEKKRIGVANVIRRLEIMFDKRFDYEIESIENVGTKIILTIEPEGNDD